MTPTFPVHKSVCVPATPPNRLTGGSSSLFRCRADRTVGTNALRALAISVSLIAGIVSAHRQIRIVVDGHSNGFVPRDLEDRSGGSLRRRGLRRSRSGQRPPAPWRSTARRTAAPARSPSRRPPLPRAREAARRPSRGRRTASTQRASTRSVSSSTSDCPPMMTNPIARLVPAPMPLETTSGNIPATNANVVIRIGRSRSRLAWSDRRRHAPCRARAAGWRDRSAESSSSSRRRRAPADRAPRRCSATAA